MDGVLNIYKDKGVTSFQVVARVRKLLKVKKCGHLGTLDPMAEGVLPICVGYATRLSEFIGDVQKEYIGEFVLGMATDSFDTTGSVTAENSTIRPDEGAVRAALARFNGKVSLTVPAYSAKKIDGERAYDLARKGLIEDAGEREMEILSCDLMNYAYPHGIIRVACAKGTYIRSIIHELGRDLGCGAAMSGLIRSCNGTFHMKNAIRLSQLEEMVAAGKTEEVVQDVNAALNWPVAVVRPEAVTAVSNGMSPKRGLYLSLPESDTDHYLIASPEGRFLAVARRDAGGANPLKVFRVFA